MQRTDDHASATSVGTTGQGVTALVCDFDNDPAVRIDVSGGPVHIHDRPGGPSSTRQHRVSVVLRGPPPPLIRARVPQDQCVEEEGETKDESSTQKKEKKKQGKRVEQKRDERIKQKKRKWKRKRSTATRLLINRECRKAWQTDRKSGDYKTAIRPAKVRGFSKIQATDMYPGMAVQFQEGAIRALTRFVDTHIINILADAHHRVCDAHHKRDHPERSRVDNVTLESAFHSWAARQRLDFETPYGEAIHVLDQS